MKHRDMTWMKGLQDSQEMKQLFDFKIGKCPLDTKEKRKEKNQFLTGVKALGST